MIYTLTLNPAIDYVVRLDKLRRGHTNRSSSEEYFLGGKGINVSRVLKELGQESIAIAITAGFTGKALEDGLKEKGVQTDFVHLENGITRINIKLKSGEETEINGQGALPQPEVLVEIKKKLSKVKAGDVVILSGSIPKTLPQDAYLQIMNFIEGISQNVKVVVDTTGKRLVEALKGKPFLIKPNRDELYDLLGEEVDPIEGTERLREMGARNVLISMGSEGAILLAEDGKLYSSKACHGKTVNTVGSGDSMVAGFVAGFIESGNYEHALKLGTASGGATAFAEDLAKAEDIKKQLESLN